MIPSALKLQAQKAEARLASEVEQHIDAEFKKCVDLAALHGTGLLQSAKIQRRAPMPMQLPPRFHNLVPKGASHVRLAGTSLLPRAGSSGQG